MFYSTIVLLRADDWEALYVDGMKVFEHHSVPLDIIARYLPPGMLVDKHVNENGEAMLNTEGEFPNCLYDALLWYDRP